MKSTHMTVRLGSSFKVELKGLPTAGYEWKMDGDPSHCALIKVTTAPGDRMGGAAIQSFVFKANTVGTEVLKFTESRSWENSVRDEYYVRVSVIGS